tara:strand:- start:14737 stop:15408 length:672 start_codon:yes stop_codon:yes gene_type:complete
MLKLALIGKDISHSQSPKIYQEILNKKHQYDLLDYQNNADIPLLEDLFKVYDGINITAPYKKKFLPELTRNESKVEGVNVIKKVGDGFIGTNTDYLACEEILTELEDKHSFENILILGDGVMANLLKVLLEHKSINYSQFSRRAQNLHLIESEILPDKKTLIINACAREYQFHIQSNARYVFWDLNYKLEHNAQFVRAQDSLYIDGIGLLVLQAKYALSFWNF